MFNQIVSVVTLWKAKVFDYHDFRNYFYFEKPNWLITIIFEIHFSFFSLQITKVIDCHNFLNSLWETKLIDFSKFTSSFKFVFCKSHRQRRPEARRRVPRLRRSEISEKVSDSEFRRNSLRFAEIESRLKLPQFEPNHRTEFLRVT